MLATTTHAPPAVRAPRDAEDALRALGIPGGGYAEGAWIRQPLTLEVADPEDDTVVAAVHEADEATMLRAIAAVDRSVRDDAWPLWQRRETLERAAHLVREEASRIAGIVSRESSKTIREATREVARAAETLRLSAAASHLLEGETLAFEDTARGAGRVGWNRRVPLGVVAAITPFNDPLNLVAHKVGPALIAGDGVVLKPARVTPLSALALLDVLLRAGMPPQRMAVLVADRAASTVLVADRRVAAVSFTGGPATGDAIARAAGARPMLMELGGNNAVIVAADGDAAAAAAGIVDGAFGVAGQNCLSVQRVFVHASHHERLVADVVARTRALVVGSKRDAATDVGPMISRREAERVERWIDEAVDAGAHVAVGGERDGAFLSPTVLLDVPRDARVQREEVFGPVVTITPFEDVEDALAQVDDTEYGLQAGIFTASMSLAMRAVERLQVGSVLVNETSDFRIDSMPFGGSKRSGVGREGVADAVLALSEPRNVILTLVDPVAGSSTQGDVGGADA
ncbi:aldehyde dehydrogenase family protein [Agrococcus sp. SGAir0287]|uniref:aldehyde dehydrogenase family protein n=1 Tax=Agrococcus sp. SGAir0287 TaxID=2070347 RepID=UPI001C305351|nr:aldehyde dehydrogenase family protein [Agrococcus sp. SGAir0287]